MEKKFISLSVFAKAGFLFLFLSFLTGCSTVEKEIRTCIFDGSSQPPLVGAVLMGYDIDRIQWKGVIVSEDSAMVVIADTIKTREDMKYCFGMTNWTDNVRPYRCIDCTPINREQFWCPLTYLKGNTKYYVRAFVKDDQGTVNYGETICITTGQFNRHTGYAGYANVFCWQKNTLFDKMTDEIIDPEKDGFFFSTHENPNSCKFQRGYARNGCFKFKTEWSYLLWFFHEAEKQIYTRNVPPAMYMENGKLVIAAKKNERVFYKINDKTGDPGTFTDVYTEPLDVSEGSRVDCYSVNKDGEMSYLNKYWVSR